MIATIVQARQGSTRLPGKSLLDWGITQSLLGRVLERLDEAEIGYGCVATTIRPEDDELAEHAFQVCGWDVYRHPGDPNDVLGRFIGCIDAMPDPPDAIFRVCADRPFIVPELVQAMCRYWEDTPGMDYLAPPSVAWAFAGEIVSVESLCRAHTETSEHQYREHVTSWIREDPVFLTCYAEVDAFNTEIFPMTIDTDADYQKLCP